MTSIIGSKSCCSEESNNSISLFARPATVVSVNVAIALNKIELVASSIPDCEGREDRPDEGRIRAAEMVEDDPFAPLPEKALSQHHCGMFEDNADDMMALDDT
jgi:hypothetical protein